MSVPVVRFIYCTGNEYIGYRVIVEHDGKFYTAKNGELLEPFMVKEFGKEFQLDCPYVCKIMKQRIAKDSKDWELSYIMQSNTDFWIASYNREGILTNMYRAAKEYEKREENNENSPKLS